MHAAVDRRVGVVALLAWRAFTVGEVMDVVVDEIVHAPLIHRPSVRGTIEHGLRGSSLPLEVVDCPAD